LQTGHCTFEGSVAAGSCEFGWFVDAEGVVEVVVGVVVGVVVVGVVVVAVVDWVKIVSFRRVDKGCASCWVVGTSCLYCVVVVNVAVEVVIWFRIVVGIGVEFVVEIGVLGSKVVGCLRDST
jgi:hypothetical protein